MSEDIKTPVTKLGPLKLDEATKLYPSTTKAAKPKRGTFFVYGAPGSGKTTFAGSAPKPVFINMQGNMTTLRHLDIPYFTPKSREDVVHILASETVGKAETLVLDQATEMAFHIYIGSAMKKFNRKDLPTLKEWQMIIEWMNQDIRSALSMPKHIIVIAEETDKTDEVTGKMKNGPDIPGKLFGRLGALFDCVFHIGIRFVDGQNKRMLLTQPDSIHEQAKDCFGVFDKLEEPDFPSLWKKVTS